jgi:hypothetical protein
MSTAQPKLPVKKRKSSNPGYTTLKTCGRQHRDEPFHLVYRIVLYPKRGKLDAEALNDWCAVRYLDDNRQIPRTRYRIETYRHKNGKKYVHRVLFEKISDEELIELKLRFGTVFGKEKVVRDGRVRRPRLSPEELDQRNEWLDRFYLDVAHRRQQAAAENAARIAEA